MGFRKLQKCCIKESTTNTELLCIKPNSKISWKLFKLLKSRTRKLGNVNYLVYVWLLPSTKSSAQQVEAIRIMCVTYLGVLQFLWVLSSHSRLGAENYQTDKELSVKPMWEVRHDITNYLSAMVPEPAIHQSPSHVPAIGLADRLTIVLYFVSPTSGNTNMLNRNASFKYFDAKWRSLKP